MLDSESTRNTVEWRQARPEDAAIWVSVTRRSADQMIVAPLFRHVGLGQLLAVRAMRSLHIHGYPTVVLYVTPGIPAVNLYQRLAFSEAGPTYIEAERMLTR